MSRYFQGNSVLGPVRASAARNFREVVDALRICPTLGITRTAFLALDKKKRNETKQVPFFVPACFKESPSKRDYPHAIHCNLVFIDLDEQKDGRCPAAPFVSNPDALYAALDGLNFAAHTTASSTREKPRMRIVVEANQIPVNAYPRAVATVAALLGLSRVNTESKVAVQPMFLPTLFSDSEDADHPLIAHFTDGRAFQASDISGELFPEFSEPQKTSPEHGVDALDFLRAPVPEITLAVAKEALEHVDPDCEHNDWVETGMALKHQFSPHKTEEAYALFDEWSSTGTKYGNSDETRKKWGTFRQHPVGRVPVTIRSLLRQAVAGGWDDKAIKETCFIKLVSWMGEVTTITELLESGVNRIMATPTLSAVQEDILVDQLRTHAKKQFAYTISATAIKKDIARLKVEIKAQEKPAEKVKEPIWAKGVCYISKTQDFLRQRTGEKFKSAAFDAIYSRKLLPTEKDLREAGIPMTPATLATPIISPSDYALNYLEIPTVFDTSYDPSQPTEVYFVHEGIRYVNTYYPPNIGLDKADASAAGEVFYRHMCNLTAEEEYRQTQIDFMAFIVQHPGRKIRFALFVQSTFGAGKTFLFEVMAAVLGARNVMKVAAGAIKRGWTEWAVGSQLVVIDEILVSGVNKHDVMNTLKEPITNSVIPVEQRNRDSRNVPNVTNYIVFSNHHAALALESGERRYHVVKSPLQNREQVLALGENYFPTLYALLRDHAGALKSWLMDWEISPSFNPDGHAPRTKYLSDMVNDSASDLTASVRRLLLEGDYPLIQYDIVSTKALMDVLQMEEGINRATSQAIASVLREEGFEQIGRHLFGTERHYLWMRRGCGEANPVDVAMERLRTGAKNLEMQMMF